MNDQSKRLAAAFRAVAKQLAALSDDEIAELVEGGAVVRIETRAARQSSGAAPRATRSRPAPSPSVDTEALARSLNECQTREDAEDLLRIQKLTVARLKDLATSLEVVVPAKANKEVLLAKIVDGTVGFRLRSRAIRGF